MPPTLWLDCDPGHDDALAIVLACCGGCDLLGVSTVSGNQSVDKTTRNAIKMLEICGKGGIPVIRGASRPLLREARHDPGIHGESGMEGSEVFNEFDSKLKEVNNERDPSYSWLGDIAGRIVNAPQKVTVVATGALTNVALLVRAHPEVLENIREISFMGGALGVGNRHPVAEFNILSDPEAAAIVVDLPVRVVMVPLEVTHTALVTPEVLSSMKAAMNDSRLFNMVKDLMFYFAGTYLKEFNFPSPPLHDPCAIAAITHPSLFILRHLRVDVVTGDHITAGQTVCDIWRYSSKPRNVFVATQMNVPEFWKIMIAALVECNKISPVNKAAKM
eukprot:TRINITY_DN8211_c0_g1_i1.p1 TRINITY_DN8211_c0_g1~~TRINITY_DN8211_c0_g1_i1.p1  ORF type:complete len:349 (+),score=55.00 TRINITY_DN8211_c0_g1_i1:53-1048(+)